MPKVIWDENCIKHLPPEIQKRFKKQIKIFEKNPNYPSLHFQTYKGLKSQNGIVWEIRINRKYRALLLQKLDESGQALDIFEVIKVGKHDILDKAKKLKQTFGL
jgi:mRNA-degrading endonuclease RelE of RelBE toxin-antitoxin system